MGLFDIFSRKETQKEPPVINGFTVSGALINYDFSFDKFYKFYKYSPFVQSVINKRSNEVGSRGWEIKKQGKTLYNSDLQDLIQTSTSETPNEFLKRLVRDYDITGNCYVYTVKDKKEINSKKIGLQILDPRYIKPVSDKHGKVLGYVQNLGGIKVFLKDEIFHLKNDNDLENEVLGTSRLSSLYVDIETDNEAKESNLAFFKNNQTPSSIVILKDGFDFDESVEMKKKIKDIFTSGKYVGGKNKHRSLIVQGVEKIEKIQDKITDAEFLELRRFTLDVVCSIYETPKSILGYTENTNYSNGETQYDIYMDMIEALEDKFADFLTKILKQFDEKYEFTFLKDNLRKLKTKSDIASKLYKDSLINKNEAREIIQYDMVEGGEEFYQNKTLNITAEEEKTKKLKNSFEKDFLPLT